LEGILSRFVTFLDYPFRRNKIKNSVYYPLGNYCNPSKFIYISRASPKAILNRKWEVREKNVTGYVRDRFGHKVNKWRRKTLKGRITGSIKAKAPPMGVSHGRLSWETHSRRPESRQRSRPKHVPLMAHVKIGVQHCILSYLVFRLQTGSMIHLLGAPSLTGLLNVAQIRSILNFFK